MTGERWPSVAKAVAAALRARFDVGSTRLTYPLDIPAAWVRRVGGADDGVTDRARVAVSVIADDEESAETLAEQIRAFLVDTKPIRGAGLLLDGAKTEVAPNEVIFGDSENPDRTQFDAIYVVDTRRDL